MTTPAFKHRDYKPKFPGAPVPELGADARVTGPRLSEVNKIAAAVADAQKRFAALAELLDEVGLEIDPTLNVTLQFDDTRVTVSLKQHIAALAMDADNSRRAMEEARAQ